MSFPLGHLPDPPGRGIGRELGHLVGAAPFVPSEVDLSGFIRPDLEQRGSSCVGAAFHNALVLGARVAGRELDPSYLAIYALARQLAEPGATHLADDGCHPFRAIEAMREWGIVARARWGDARDLGDRVAVDVLEAGSLARVSGVYRIEEAGAARALRVRQALACGHGVVFGMSIDAAYRRGPGTFFDGLRGTSVGSHAQLLVGYRDGAFKALNQWGPRWNGDGCVWLDEAWIEDGPCFDFTVITSLPESVQ